MIFVPRTDRTLVGNWWWTVDRMMLAGVGFLALVGLVLIFAASPAVGKRVYGAEMARTGRAVLCRGYRVNRFVPTALTTVALLVPVDHPRPGAEHAGGPVEERLGVPGAAEGGRGEHRQPVEQANVLQRELQLP